MDVEQYRVATISTAHLEARTAEALTRNAGGKGDPDFLGFSAAVYEDGFFVTCFSAPAMLPQDEAHPSLWAVRAWGRRNGFMVVQLDTDANAVEDLPTHEW